MSIITNRSRRKRVIGLSENGNKIIKITSINPITKAKKTKEIESSSYIKNIEKSKYNPKTGKSIFKEKQIEYKSTNNPRHVFISKETVRRDKNNNWKSLTESKKLRLNGIRRDADKSTKRY